ncbi:hypothetical protein EDB89DRAFT_1904497 [Lactarius sanguifluus]|nr:hypothetical protein EDB89DRAFT_1904497 [Lactarius sanguifluus]
MPSDVDPFDDEDMYSVDYNDEAISIGSDSDHFISERSNSDVSDLGGTNSDGESQHLSGIMCDKTILQVERLQNDSENIFVMAKALCDSQGIVLSSNNKEHISQDISLCVTAQPGQDPRNYQKYTQEDLRWDREDHGATAVLEGLLEKWKKEPRAQDHVRVGRMVGVIGHHMTPACDLPRTVRKSLDELVPRLRLEYGDPMTVWLTDANREQVVLLASHRRLLDLITITLALALALIGHALRIALAVAYGVLKTFEHVQQQQTGN